MDARTLSPRAGGPDAAAPLAVLFDHQITTVQSHGGVSRYVVELLRALQGVPDVQARLLAAAHRNDYLRDGDALHPLSFELRGPERGLQHRPRLCEPLLRLALAGGRPQVLHETWYLPRRRRPAGAHAVVTTLHDMTPELMPATMREAGRVVAAKRAALERADAVICVSAHTRRDLLALYPQLDRKARVVWHGVDHRVVPAAPPPLLAQSPYLLFVGQRGGYKNFTRLVQGYAASARLRADLRLLCFGGGPFVSDEKSLFASLGLDDRHVQQMAGPDALLASAYAHARVFVFPSLYEGFGMPLAEAMVQGAVIACSRASCFPEVAGDAALYFDPTDIESMAHTLEQAVFDDTLRVELRASARARAALFSWDRCAADTAQIYREVGGLATAAA